MTLDEARDEINDIDSQLAALFERRMKAVESVIAHKIENDLPIFDAKREAQVIEKNLELITNNNLKPYFNDFLIEIMRISKTYQKHILEKSDQKII